MNDKLTSGDIKKMEEEIEYRRLVLRPQLLEDVKETRAKTRKITQNELAEAVDVTRQTIISLENGKYNASLLLAHKIAQFFNMKIEEIFIFDKEEENI